LPTTIGASGWRKPVTRSKRVAKQSAIAQENAEAWILSARIPPARPPVDPTTIFDLDPGVLVKNPQAVPLLKPALKAIQSAPLPPQPPTKTTLKMPSSIRRISQSIEVPPAADSTDAAKATGSTAGNDDKKKVKKDDDADTESEKESNTLSPADLTLSRPLSAVSLSVATQSATLSGEPLKQPEDQAAQIFATYGTYLDTPLPQRSLRPARNLYPVYFNPLYFEDPNLECCGIGCGCLTEVASAIHFFGRAPLVPYMMGSTPPCCCVRSLGDCHSCQGFGCHAYLPPPNQHGVATQVAFTVGAIFLIP